MGWRLCFVAEGEGSGYFLCRVPNLQTKIVRNNLCKWLVFYYFVIFVCDEICCVSCIVCFVCNGDLYTSQHHITILGSPQGLKYRQIFRVNSFPLVHLAILKDQCHRVAVNGRFYVWGDFHLCNTSF